MSATSGYVRAEMRRTGRPMTVKELASSGYRSETAIRQSLWGLWRAGWVEFTRDDMRKPCQWTLVENPPHTCRGSAFDPTHTENSTGNEAPR
jgi:hypothetical protein